MKKIKPEDEEAFLKKPKGKPSPFDETKFLEPVNVIKRGIAIIHNELGRLAENSKTGGLSAMESMSLNAYVKTVSDVAHKHKALNFGILGQEADKMSMEELQDTFSNFMHEQDLAEVLGPKGMAFYYNRKTKPKIANDSN